MVYVGSSGVQQPGFLSMPRHFLDVTKPDDYARWFCLSSVDKQNHHTFEHIPGELHDQAFRLMHAHLKPGGRLRIAVPVYKENHVERSLDVKYGHVAFITKKSLTTALSTAGFQQVHPLEYVDVDTQAAYTAEYDSCDGRIQRSLRHDERNLVWLQEHAASLNKSAYNDIGDNVVRPPPLITSLVLDAMKG